MSCPRCGAESLPDQSFCKNCGARLATAEPAQPATVASAAPQPSPAPPLHSIPDGGLTLEEVVQWLESAGYPAKVVAGNSGKLHVESITQDTPVAIMLDLKGGRSAFLNCVSGFSTHGKFDLAHINAWNYDNRWCTAYYDDVNDPWLGMAISLWPGGTYESLNDQFATWNETLGSFIDNYGLK
jgi:Putative bacterial sensory transduction regulator/zinc-ribbon domain